jgi:WD40 repeat protein
VGVDLLDVVAAVDGATVKPVMSLRGGGADGQPPLDASSLVSLSFYGDQEVLAAAGEEGDVVLWDLGTGKQLRRFCADACGLTQIEFTRSGQLVTCGMATTHQLQMWDIRCGWNRAVAGADAGADVAFSRALQHPAVADGNLNDPRQSRSQLYYTSVSTQSLYNKVLCGTSRGGLAVWDLRSEVVAQYQPHAANARVTAILAHPWKQDLLVSASTDGTVKTSDLLRQGGVGGGSAALHTTVVTEPAAFQGVDCDRDSGLLAAYSTLGGLWRLQLS